MNNALPEFRVYRPKLLSRMAIRIHRQVTNQHDWKISPLNCANLCV
jgi:hypothetical protein